MAAFAEQRRKGKELQLDRLEMTSHLLEVPSPSPVPTTRPSEEAILTTYSTYLLLTTYYLLYLLTTYYLLYLLTTGTGLSEEARGSAKETSPNALTGIHI